MAARTTVAALIGCALLTSAADASAEVSPDGRRADPIAELAGRGMALELLARAAAIGNAARSCSGAACERVAGMLPVVGAIETAVAHPDDAALASALAAMEVTALALVLLDVVDGGSDDRAAVRVGLRGPGLVISGRF